MADWYQGALGYYVYYHSSEQLAGKKKDKRIVEEKKTQKTIRLYQNYINSRIKRLKDKNQSKTKQIQEVFNEMNKNKIHMELWNKVQESDEIKKVFINSIRKNIGEKAISINDLEAMLSFDTDTQTIVAKDTDIFTKIKTTKIQSKMKNKIAQNSQQAQKKDTFTEYTHVYLSTLIRRAEELKNAIQTIKEEDIKQELNKKTSSLIKNIRILTDNHKKVYAEMVKLDKIKKRNIEKIALEENFTNVDNTLSTVKNIVEEINLIAAATEAAIVRNINAAISEIVGSLIVKDIKKLTAETLNKFLTKMVVGGQTVGTFLDSPKMVLSQKFVELNKNSLKKKHIKKSIKVNDQYQYDFGAAEAKNKIDFFLELKIKNNKQKIPISYKRFGYDFPFISFSKSTSLLAYLGAIQIVKTQENMGTEIINALTNRPKIDTGSSNIALSTLKKQIIYAALTGELGGRMLLNNNKKAEFLVIENSNTPSKKKVYSIGDLLDDLDLFYLKPDEISWKKAFEQKYEGDIDNRSESFIRITKLLTKLRTEKISVGLKRQAAIF